MSNAPPNGYTMRLVYYGRADLTHRDSESNFTPSHPKVSTQNVRIIAFPGGSETADYIGVYELVKNEETEK